MQVIGLLMMTIYCFVKNDLGGDMGPRFGTLIWRVIWGAGGDMGPGLVPLIWDPEWDPDLGPRFGTPIWDPI
jgi:hypothetical protein